MVEWMEDRQRVGQKDEWTTTENKKVHIKQSGI